MELTCHFICPLTLTLNQISVKTVMAWWHTVETPDNSFSCFPHVTCVHMCFVLLCYQTHLSLQIRSHAHSLIGEMEKVLTYLQSVC